MVSVGVHDVECVQLRRYQRTHCIVDKRAWHDKLRQLHVLYKKKDSEHWQAKIDENKGDMKEL